MTTHTALLSQRVQAIKPSPTLAVNAKAKAMKGEIDSAWAKKVLGQ